MLNCKPFISIVLLSGLLSAANVSAAPFYINIDSGPNLGGTFNGSFSFDNSILGGVGDEVIALDNFAASFEGINFTLADDAFAEAVFVDGDFLGLSYFAATSGFEFSLTPGFFDLSEAYFSYDIFAEGVGFGSVAYTVVPLPGALPLMVMALGLFGWLGRKRG
ncbi:hypothetical protein MNBD_GAMMA25-1106 [hydrothermal vent metagenome]|uniref:PEP-CTERM protein-sorting domain-containing protein n=1 Tax=hydrothermal vent metagenome TaxID=652676 RepID=A0A3B1B1C0_9ZZZZ